jgi:hypothetical protein
MKINRVQYLDANHSKNVHTKFRENRSASSKLVAGKHTETMVTLKGYFVLLMVENTREKKY